MTNTETNWSTFYSELQKQAQVPNAAAETIEASHAIFRGMYLDLGDLKQKIIDSNVNPMIVTVYADVLNIPANLNWLLNQQALVLNARRIQCGESATVLLNYRDGQASSLVVYTHDISEIGRAHV